MSRSRWKNSWWRWAILRILIVNKRSRDSFKIITNWIYSRTSIKSSTWLIGNMRHFNNGVRLTKTLNARCKVRGTKVESFQIPFSTEEIVEVRKKKTSFVLFSIKGSPFFIYLLATSLCRKTFSSYDPFHGNCRVRELKVKSLEMLEWLSCPICHLVNSSNDWFTINYFTPSQNIRRSIGREIMRESLKESSFTKVEPMLKLKYEDTVSISRKWRSQWPQHRVSIKRQFCAINRANFLRWMR